MKNFNPDNPIYDEYYKRESINIDEVFRDLEDDVINLLEKLKEKILHHEYGAVLGVDSSGRVPALLVGETINKIYEHNQQSRIPEFFITGFSKTQNLENKYQELLNFLDKDEFKKQCKNNKRILVIDDTIALGNSIKPVIDAIKEKEYIFDIGLFSVDDAVHGLEYDQDKYKESIIKKIEEKVETPINYGSFGCISEIYGKRQMIGVHKDPESLHAKPLRVPVQSLGQGMKIPDTEGVLRTPEPKSHKQNYDVLKYTRQKIHEVSDKLAKQFIVDNL